MAPTRAPALRRPPRLGAAHLCARARVPRASQDGQWYNAKIVALAADGYFVTFLGYGNTAQVDFGEVRPYQRPDTTDWRAGAECIAVHAADGRWYEAKLLAVRATAVSVRFNGESEAVDVDLDAVRMSSAQGGGKADGASARPAQPASTATTSKVRLGATRLAVAAAAAPHAPARASRPRAARPARRAPWCTAPCPKPSTRRYPSLPPLCAAAKAARGAAGRQRGDRQPQEAQAQHVQAAREEAARGAGGRRPPLELAALREQERHDQNDEEPPRPALGPDSRPRRAGGAHGHGVPLFLPTHPPTHPNPDPILARSSTTPPLSIVAPNS